MSEMRRTRAQAAAHRSICELGVEVGGVGFGGEGGLEWGDDVLALELCPVDIGEEGVFAEFFGVLYSAQTVLGVPVEKLQKSVPGKIVSGWGYIHP